MKTVNQLTDIEIKAGIRALMQGYLNKGYKAEALHTYTNGEGEPLYWRSRLRGSEGKKIFPVSWNGEVFELKEPTHDGKKPLYGLAKIKDADTIYLVEGEYKADWLNKIGIATVATTGASSHDSLDFAPLAGKSVYLWPDNDEAGKKHMEAVRSLLNGLGCTTHLIDIDALELPPKGDAYDWLKAHHTAIFNKPSAEVLKAAKDAVLGLSLVTVAAVEAAETNIGTNATETLDEVISRLSELRPAEYDREKKGAAEKLGISLKALDAEIRIKQKEKDLASDAPFTEVEPWPSPVNGNQLLQDVTNTIHKYVICSRHTARSAALWIAHTYLLDVIHCSPLAIITAPDKGCGKSTLLDVMSDMVYQPIPTASISAAALYRTIEEYQPTLLIDEVDSFLSGNEDMRGIINCGHKRKAAYVMRCDGDDNKPKRFSTWAAKLLSGISAKNLHPTITSRAILLELRKKLPTETIASNRNNQVEYHAISRKLLRWTRDIADQVRQATTALPNTLDDRQKDNWEPLLTVADIAGGQWPELARETALALSSQEENKSYKTELLEDIKSVFEARKIDRISTHDLIADLCADDEANWATYNRGKEISPKQLANLLKGYGIISNTLRFGNQSPAKGFEKSQFLDVWARYVDVSLTPLPVLTPFPLQTNEYKAQSVTAEKPLSVTRNNECNGVTGVTGNENLSVTLEANKYMACNGIDPKSGVSSAHTSNLTKDELDASWDRLINEPDVRTAL